MKHTLTYNDYASIEKTTPVSWIIHYVGDSKSFQKNRADAHTHGLVSYCGYELQLTLSLKPSLVKHILNTLGCFIASKTLDLNSGDYIYGLFADPDMPLMVEENFDSEGSSILRILIPDENGKFGDKASYPYNTQSSDPYIH